MLKITTFTLLQIHVNYFQKSTVQMNKYSIQFLPVETFI